MATYGRLKALGEERFTKITNELMQGASPYRLARTIKMEWGLFPEVSDFTLCQQLRRFAIEKSRELGLDVKKLSAADRPKTPKIWKDRKKLDVLHELKRLSVIYTRRETRLLALEEKKENVSKELNNIMRAHQELIVAAQKIQFELGLDDFKGLSPVTQTQTLTQFTDKEGSSVARALSVTKEVFLRHKVFVPPTSSLNEVEEESDGTDSLQ